MQPLPPLTLRRCLDANIYFTHLLQSRGPDTSPQVSLLHVRYALEHTGLAGRSGLHRLRGQHRRL